MASRRESWQRRDIVLFLALVGVIGGGIIAGAVVLLGRDGEDGGGLCDKPVAPRGQSDFSDAGFAAEDAGLAAVMEAAAAGSIQAAEEAFFGDVQNFARNVDGPLRAADEGLAEDLCEAMTDLEKELALDRSAERIGEETERVRELLREAAEELGYARPGG